MREFLRTLAWSMYSRASDSMAIEDVLPLAKDFFPGQDESALTELSEVAVVNAPEIKKGEETGFEFVHKSFSEYLVAERIARSIEHVSHRVADIDGRETWQFSSEEAARKVAEVLAIRVLPGEVQEMLEPMLGSFVAFHRGAKVEDAVSSEIRLAGLLRVRLRFQELYCGILNGSALGIVMEATKLFPLVGSPLEANACYCTGVVLVGAAASRRLQAERPKSSSNQGGFSLEPFEGALWRWLMLVHAGGVYVDGEIATRLYEGIDLHCSHGDKRKTADSTFPIKLGLLQGRPGYQSSLREALDQHQHAIQGIVEIMVAMNVALLRLKEEGREGVGSSREEVPMNTERKMRRRRQGLQVRGELTHFAEHVGREIENTGSSLEHTLEKCGLLTVQRVKPTRTRRRMTPSGPEPKDEDVAGSRASAFELFQMPAERIQHIYRSIATIFCGLDGEDYLDYLDWIISEDPRKTKPGRKRGRSVPRQE
jgi:hypothetical protein